MPDHTNGCKSEKQTQAITYIHCTVLKLKAMIRNIENNKFLNANNYKGLSGEFIEGIGVAFDSKEDAFNYNMTSGQRMTFVIFLETIEHNSNILYKYTATNVWD